MLSVARRPLVRTKHRVQSFHQLRQYASFPAGKPQQQSSPSSSSSSSSSSSPKPIQIAVVGSGPSSFYTILHLLQKHSPSKHLQVDVFEKLPIPFGLSRYGVAPDHPEVKNCEDKFDEIVEHAGSLNQIASKRPTPNPNLNLNLNADNGTQNSTTTSKVNFYGNIEIGTDLSLATLKQNYNILIFAYGCTHEKTLPIKGAANGGGIISARKFVGWYNGLPSQQHLDPPLDQVEDVTIIGNGNVALDIARVLLAPPDVVWSKTDISPVALSVLRKSRVKNVRIVARRGFLQSAFTNKELRELLELGDKFGVRFQGVEKAVLEPVRLVKAGLSRLDKRRLDMLDKYAKKQQQLADTDSDGHGHGHGKTWSLEYCKSPVEVYPSKYNPSTLLSSTKFTVNRLVETDVGNGSVATKVVPTDKTVSFKNELLITSIGYLGEPLPGMKEDLGIEFDAKRGVVPNVNSRVVGSSAESQALEGVYVSGWIKHGPKGVIATTMMDSFSTAEEILKDIETKPAMGSKLLETKAGFSGIVGELQKHGARYTTWEDWKKIDKVERSRGAEMGKVREKIVDVEEMLAVAGK